MDSICHVGNLYCFASEIDFLFSRVSLATTLVKSNIDY